MLLLRVGVSGGVVALLLARVDLGDLANTLAEAEPVPAALGLATLIANIAFIAYRWGVFVEQVDPTVRGATLFRLTFVGTFFNAFLPTGFGGDVFKAHALRGVDAGMSRFLATTVLDRVAGLVGLAVLSLLGAAVRLVTGDPSGVWIDVLAGSGVVLGTLLVLALSGRVASGGRPVRGWRRFVATLASVGLSRHAKVRGLALGIASALVFVVSHGFLAAAVGVSVPVAALPGIVLVASLASALPVSVNGLGVREAAFVWSLGILGVAEGRALAFAVLVLVTTLAASVVGGLVYAIAGAKVDRRARPESG